MFSFVAVAVLASSVIVGAQAPTGSVNGALRDSSGGVLPGVTLTLIEENSGAERSAVTGDAGGYEFPSVTPGSYTVRATLPGFSVSEKPRVRVDGMPVVLDKYADLPMDFADATLVALAEARLHVRVHDGSNRLFGLSAQGPQGISSRAERLMRRMKVCCLQNSALRVTTRSGRSSESLYGGRTSVRTLSELLPGPLRSAHQHPGLASSSTGVGLIHHIARGTTRACRDGLLELAAVRTQSLASWP